MSKIKSIKEHNIGEYLIKYMTKYKTRNFCEYFENDKYIVKKYSDALNDINRYANYLAREFPGEARRISLIGETTYNWVICYLSIILSGHIAVPIDNKLSNDLLNKRLRFIEPTLCICTEKRINSIKSDNVYEGRILTFNDLDEKSHERLRFKRTLRKVLITDIAEILFTSGTHSNPHGVMLTHESLLANIDFISRVRAVKSYERIYTFLPNNHVFFLTSFLLTSLITGAFIFLSQNYFNYQSDIKKFKPTTIFTVPRVLINFKRLIQRQVKGANILETDISHVSSKINIEKIIKESRACLGGKLYRLASGGAPLGGNIQAFFKNLNINLLNGYGMTECGPIISAGLKPGKKSVGIINDNCKLKIVNNQIYVSGAILMKGYFKERDLTHYRIVDGWFETGDLGFIKDNELYITGRKKNLIVLSNGENVSPELLESLVLRHPLVNACMVVDENDHIVAKVWPTICSMNVNSEIESYVGKINAKLPEFEHIQSVKFSNSDFPRTSNGKLIR
ncbi:AMP-binding protein [Lactiplantibacillus plantarum]|uniref:AMP-binding protein n=1 Tax=Lactiplantibacillus plantarum TaxID=1590 RepID=UPI001C1F5F5B|nr:AMP-binding protein [Lactiplantibacillus plantarum]